MADFAHLEIRITATGAKAARDAVRGIDDDVNKVTQNLNQNKLDKPFFDARNAITAMKTALSGLALGVAAREVIQFTDAWTNASNQLRLYSTDAIQLAKTQKDLLALANNSRADFGATATLFSRIARSTQELGLEYSELLGVTETINKAFAASGATATEAENAIRQLAQGLAAGALRGDEFNSVAEQAPAIMEAIADYTGMAIGELRAFAAEGKISAELVVEALQSASDAIGEDFANSVESFGSKLQKASNNLQAFFGGVESNYGTIGKFGDAIVLLSENMDIVAAASTGLAASWTAGLFPAIAGITGPIGIAVGGFATLVASLDGVIESSREAQAALLDQLESEGLGSIDEEMADLIERMNAARDQGFADSVKATFGFGDDYRVLMGQLEELIALREQVFNETNAPPVQDAHVQARTEALKAESEAQASLAKNIERTNEAMADYQKEASGYIRSLIEELDSATFSQSLNDLEVELNLSVAEVDFLATHSQGISEVAEVSREAALGTLGLAAAIAGLGQEIIDQDAHVQAWKDNIEDAFTQPGGDAPFPAQDPARIKYVEDQTAAQEEFTKALTKTDKALNNMYENIQREWGNEIYNLLDEGQFRFENFFDAVLDGFKRLVAEMIAADLMNAVFGVGQGGNITGLINGIFGGGSSSPGQAVTNSIVGQGGNGIIGSAVNGIVSGGGFGDWFSGVFGNGYGTSTTLVGPPTQAAASGSGFGSNLVNAGINVAAGVAGNYVGTEIGEAVSGKQAESNWGATSGAIIGSTLGPIGTIIGSTIGSFVDVLSGGDGYVRTNAGLLTAPTPGADPNRTFAVTPFESGFAPTGFTRRGTQADANQIIDIFRFIDSSAVEWINALGGSIDLTGQSLDGLNEDGQFGTRGTFLGIGGKTEDFDAQLLYFGKQIFARSDLPSDIKARIAGVTSQDQLSTVLQEELAKLNAATVAEPAVEALEQAAEPTLSQQYQSYINSNLDKFVNKGMLIDQTFGREWALQLLSAVNTDSAGKFLEPTLTASEAGQLSNLAQNAPVSDVVDFFVNNPDIFTASGLGADEIIGALGSREGLSMEDSQIKYAAEVDRLRSEMALVRERMTRMVQIISDWNIDGMPAERA